MHQRKFNIKKYIFDNSYKFAHDRIQQAVYSLIPNDNKPAQHWQIGQTLLKNTPIEQREKNIFAFDVFDFIQSFIIGGIMFILDMYFYNF